MNSLSNIVQLDYSSLLAEYDRVMNHLFESSDAFAVVADLKKPYSKLPPNVRQNDFAESLKDYALSQITDERKWCEGVERRGKHKVLLTFRACRQAMEIARERAICSPLPQTPCPKTCAFCAMEGHGSARLRMSEWRSFPSNHRMTRHFSFLI